MIACMDNSVSPEAVAYKIGDRSTSDVVARLRTPDGRDEWVYCHSSILIPKSKYFADRLSDDWPTCQILDARNCVEVYCQDPDFDYHITLLRLLYLVFSPADRGLICETTLHNVKNTLGILRAGLELGCPEIVSACVEYLEAVPWEEGEEDEILRIIPSMGSVAEPILSRLQPVHQLSIEKVFLSAMRFATSIPATPHLNNLKSSVQEQLEYMLAEDDDAPLVEASSNIEIRSKISELVKGLLGQFLSFLGSLVSDDEHGPPGLSLESENLHLLQTYLSDILWACQILSKSGTMRELVMSWTEISPKLIKILDSSTSKVQFLEVKLKAIEVTSKVLEAIAYGTAILPSTQRLHMVRTWLPFVRTSKPLIDVVACNGCVSGNGNSSDDEGSSSLKVDADLWQSLESALVSAIVALPSSIQAEILTEWFGDRYIGYPDLTEAFEVWCYRSKVANKRLASFGDSSVCVKRQQ